MARVFVNHVDSYAGRVLSKVLAASVVGAASEEKEADEDIDSQPPAAAQAGSGSTRYQVVGTLRDAQAEHPEWVAEVVKPATEAELVEVLLGCDIIVYNIVEEGGQVEEASRAITALHENISSIASQKVFVCISTVLTWARSKPLDPEEPDVPFTEEDYRRRRAHPNFKEHLAAEKLIIKLGKTDKSKLSTYVVASGLTYGAGESIFHFLFKSAWHGDPPALPVLGEGDKTLPTIHIHDLASVIVRIVDMRPSKPCYMLAVDESRNTLKELTKAVSVQLGTGRVRSVSREEALLIRELSQSEYDQLLVDLQMEATSIKDSMTISWKSESGLAEGVAAVVKEFKETRDLLPLRVCVLGPPAVGKTLVVQQLCHHYKLHHLTISKVISDYIEKLERTAARVDVEEEEEDEEEDDSGAQDAKGMLDTLKADKDENDGRYSDQYIIDIFAKTLKSKPCQNQGFILDGFPKTYEQAKALFDVGEEEAEEEEEEEEGRREDQPMYNKHTMPAVVISLDAGEEFLRQRVMNLPESQVSGTHNTEEGLTRRLKEFRILNEEDSTVLNYFDEKEVHPDHIDTESDASPSMQATVDKMKTLIGEPKNYGPSPEEKAAIEQAARKEKMRRERQEREETERQEAAERAEWTKRETEWSSQLSQVQSEEQQMLEAKSLPLRNYLMRHVMPTLTRGLIEVCKSRPEDPVDYLAEYLFKCNPQID